MPYPTPRQCQLLAQGERLSNSSLPSPSKIRALETPSSPGIPTSSRSVVLSPRSESLRFQEDDSGNEDQGTAFSRDSSESGSEERTKHSMSTRQRQEARLCRVRNLIDFIEVIKNGGYLGRNEAIPIQLFPKDYIELLLEVDERDIEFQNYFNNRLRYEYRESRYGKSQFTIFMLSDFHKRMQSLINVEVHDWKNHIKSSDNHVAVNIAAKNIEIATDEFIATPDGALLPDNSFKYEGIYQGIYRPPVAFEIAWSQSTDDLKRKALELIRKTKGEVRTVVGLNFRGTWDIWPTIRDHVGTEELPNRGPASAFVWRARFDENGQQLFNADGQPSVQKENYSFCDNNGNAYAQPRAKLQLSLKDFIPLQVISAEGWNEVEALENTKLELGPVKMIKYFDKALRVEKASDKAQESRRQEEAQKKLELKRELEDKQNAAADREHRRQTILDIANIGGHSLRRSARPNSAVGRIR